MTSEPGGRNGTTELQWGALAIGLGVALWAGRHIIRLALGLSYGYAGLFKLLGWIVGVFGMSLYNRGRRLRLILSESGSPPPEPARCVLYLRSFEADADAGATWRGGIEVFVQGWLALLSVRTEEEQLVRAVAPIGPTLALGEPGTELPRLGAWRVQVPHDQWRETVREKLSECRAVVLRVAASPGVLWEVGEAVRQIDPRRLILIVAHGRKQYSRRLPAYAGRLGLGSIRGFVVFGADWEPKFRPLSRELYRARATELMTDLIQLSLQSKIQELTGKRLSHPIRSTIIVAAFFVFLMLLYAIAVMTPAE